MSAHPTQEDIAGYMITPMDDAYAHIADHLRTCNHCKSHLGQMENVLASVKQLQTRNVTVLAEPHISDESMIGYVHHTISASETHETENHLHQCGECMKAVLRYRAFLAENSHKQKTATATGHHEPTHKTPNASLLSFRSRRRRKYSTGITAPIAVAATVLVAFYAFMSLNPVPQPARVATTPQQFSSPDTTGFHSTVSSPENIIAVNSTPDKTKPGNSVDWYQGYIKATATGTADMSKMKNRIQAEGVAEKTARHLAYARLAETLHGIQVTSDSTYRQLLLKVDSLGVKSEGFIQGAEVIEKKITWEDNAPRAVITVRIPVLGNNSVRHLLQSNVPAHLLQGIPKQESVPGRNDQNKSMLYQATHTTENSEKYRNVIIDASNTEFSPSLFPRLITGNNKSDDAENLVRDYRYYPDLSSARSATTTGENPLVIRAVSGQKSGTLVIDETDGGSGKASWVRDLANNPSLSVVF